MVISIRIDHRPNLKLTNIKFLEENLCNIGLGKVFFFRYDTKNIIHKRKIILVSLTSSKLNKY